MDIYHNYVLQVNKYGSFTRAASELGISQPALSMGISQLEKKLGFVIFNRKTSPLTLTKSGELYVEYLHKQDANRFEFQKKLEDLSNDYEHHISVGSPNVYISSIIAPCVKNILEGNHHLKLNIKSGTVPEMIELCERSGIDFFISTEELPQDTFTSIPIRTEETFLCMNDSYKETVFEDLPFIFLQDEQPLQKALNILLNQKGICISPSVTVDQVTTALTLAVGGIGACLATSESISAFGDVSSLYIRSLSEYIPSRTVYAAYLKDRYISKACINMINILKEGHKKCI